MAKQRPTFKMETAKTLAKVARERRNQVTGRQLAELAPIPDFGPSTRLIELTSDMAAGAGETANFKFVRRDPGKNTFSIHGAEKECVNFYVNLEGTSGTRGRVENHGGLWVLVDLDCGG